YVVNDFYKRFVNPQASQKQLVAAGRWSTVGLMIITSLMALLLSNALQAFNILLQVGAGTGLIYILRWFWWRINAISEITAMIVSFLVAVYFQLIHPQTAFPELSSSFKLLSGVGFTTLVWLTATFLTKPVDREKLRSFYRLIQPGGPGWKKIVREAREDGEPVDEDEGHWDVPIGILCMVLGITSIYSALFATGNWIYGHFGMASGLTALALLSGYYLSRMWRKLRLK
ncbi:MAG: hypothetical protein K9I47_09765, partial [Bacteroidales bacterium]|nr:hypothetical protein [Bacteroidales bacterium]